MRSRALLLSALLLLPACDDATGPDGDEMTSAGGKADDTNSAPQTYGALASATTPAALRQILDGVPTIEDGAASIGELGEDTLPQDVKAIRKELVRVRDLVDIFSYAYPEQIPVEAEALGDDLWRVLRDDLDEGYELMGAYKDLADGQVLEEGEEPTFEEAELVELRTPLLEWARGFEARGELYLPYLQAASETEIHDRKNRHMSRFFWVAIDKKPKLDLSGIDNIARLDRELAEASLEELEAINDLKNIVKEEEDEERFHDYRKLLRTVEKVATYFPEIWNGELDHTPFLQVVADNVDLLGDINDLLIGIDKLEDDARDQRADEVDDMWDAFRKDTDELEDALDVIQGLLDR